MRQRDWAECTRSVDGAGRGSPLHRNDARLPFGVCARLTPTRRIRMAASPWKQFEAMAPDREYFVMASHLPLKTMGATPRMLGLASAVRRQLKDTPGIVGYSLDAKVFAKDYFTLSVWEDEARIPRLRRPPAPRRGDVEALEPDMGETKFIHVDDHRHRRPAHVGRCQATPALNQGTNLGAPPLEFWTVHPRPSAPSTTDLPWLLCFRTPVHARLRTATSPFVSSPTAVAAADASARSS